MGIIVPNGVTTGFYPLPETAIRLAAKPEINSIPAGLFEFKPVIPTLNPVIKSMLDSFGGGSFGTDVVPKYISPYDICQFDFQSIPLWLLSGAHPLYGPGGHYILNVDVQGPIACMLEDPLPSTESIKDTLRSLGKFLRVGISPWWAPGPLFIEPFITTSNVQPPLLPSPVSQSPAGTGIGYPLFTSRINGYYTDRNFWDRQWILQERDVIAKYNSFGRFTKPWKPGREQLPLDELSINQFQPSAINPYTWFSSNLITAGCAEDVMLPYIRCADQILQYKPTEIRALRFYYIVNIQTAFYKAYKPFPPFFEPPPPVILENYPYLCHMTVDAQHDILSIFKLLCSQQLVGGCTSREFENLSEVKQPTPDDTLESECFTDITDFNTYNEELRQGFEQQLQELREMDTI